MPPGSGSLMIFGIVFSYLMVFLFVLKLVTGLYFSGLSILKSRLNML